MPSNSIAIAPSPFLSWTDQDARDALAEATGPIVPIVRAFLEGDHWQEGDGWVGPAPSPDEGAYAETMALIEARFVSRNAIAEIAHRHTNGVVGREPRWRFVPREFRPADTPPNPAEVEEIAELESLLTNWWNARGVIAAIQAATLTVLYAERGPLRVYVPRGLLAEFGDGSVPVAVVEKGDLAGALDLLWVEALRPEDAMVYTDPTTRQQVGIVIELDEETETELTHLVFRDPTQRDPQTGQPLTVHLVIGQGTTTGELSVVMNLNGLLPVVEMARPRLISDQIIQGQKALNLALSMIPRTVTQAGFLERTLLGAQLPGEYVDVKDASGKVTGRKFVPGIPTFGAGTTNYVQPIVYEEDDGQGGTRMTLSRPDIKYHEPSDPKASVVAKLAHYQDMLEEANQSHILITSNATPSGMSREQARSEYEASLNETKPHADTAGRNLLDVVVAYAEYLAGVPGKYSAKYRAVFECNVDTGPLTSDEKRQNTEAAKEGFLSAQGAMELNGVEDVDAEVGRIRREGAGNVGQMLKRIEGLKTLKDAGFPLEPGLKLLGFPDEMIPEIVAAAKAEADLAAAREQAKVKEAAAARPQPALA